MGTTAVYIVYALDVCVQTVNRRHSSRAVVSSPSPKREIQKQRGREGGMGEIHLDTGLCAALAFALALALL